MWPLLKPFLFWKGETLLEDGEKDIYLARQTPLHGECHTDKSRG